MQPAAESKSAVIFHRYLLSLRAVETLLRKTGLTIVGTATDPEEALALLAADEPDLFVAAVSTPPGSIEGVELLRRAREVRPSLKMIGLADDGDDHLAEEVFAAGASAFLGKTARQADLAFAVTDTYEPSIHLASARGDAAQPQPSPGAPILTEREGEILGLLAEGHSNAELAQMLDVAVQTIKYHLSNIYRKLDVGNRTHATRQAQLLNLLPREPNPVQASRAEQARLL